MTPEGVRPDEPRDSYQCSCDRFSLKKSKDLLLWLVLLSRDFFRLAPNRQPSPETVGSMK
jgi:hypothetical protein